MNQLNENMAIMIDNMNTMVTNMYNQNVAHQEAINNQIEPIRKFD